VQPRLGGVGPGWRRLRRRWRRRQAWGALVLVVVVGCVWWGRCRGGREGGENEEGGRERR